MTDSFTLGRIAGIKVGVNWSWVVVFALIVWTLSQSIFPRMNEGLSDATVSRHGHRGGTAFLHLPAHARVRPRARRRREGMEIDGITLWLFGGVARFKGMFPSAGAEFRIAIAGPLVSLALGVLFVLFAWLVPAPEAGDGVAAWLGYINLTLLVFNLLPALPLDGGRVLRSALWAARDDFAWATRIAAWVGRAFGYLFIAVGLGLLIFQGAFSGAWLAFIGWFLLQAAGAGTGISSHARHFPGSASQISWCATP